MRPEHNIIVCNVISLGVELVVCDVEKRFHSTVFFLLLVISLYNWHAVLGSNNVIAQQTVVGYTGW